MPPLRGTLFGKAEWRARRACRHRFKHPALKRFEGVGLEGKGETAGPTSDDEDVAGIDRVVTRALELGDELHAAVLAAV